jgi:hypothetical protein
MDDITTGDHDAVEQDRVSHLEFPDDSIVNGDSD